MVGFRGLTPAWDGLSQSSVTRARSHRPRGCRGFLSLTGCSTPGHRRSAAPIEKTFNRLADHQLGAVDAAFFTTNGVLSVVMCLLLLFAKMQAAL